MKIARSHASGNRRPGSVPLVFGNFVIHPGRRRVQINGITIGLTILEFLVLHFPAKKPGWVYSRYQIVEGVRGDNYPVTDRSVDVAIVGLRKNSVKRATESKRRGEPEIYSRKHTIEAWKLIRQIASGLKIIQSM